MRLTELYQETPGDSFTHDGVKYDINKVFKAVDKDPVVYFNVADLEWMLDEASDEERTVDADLTAPILCALWKHKWAVIDGFHRLQKAHAEKVKQLPGKVVMQDVLSKYKLDKD
jgi:hypothetical protein